MPCGSFGPHMLWGSITPPPWSALIVRHKVAESGTYSLSDWFCEDVKLTLALRVPFVQDAVESSVHLMPSSRCQKNCVSSQSS